MACKVGDLDLGSTPTRRPTPTWTPYATLPPLGIRAAGLADRYDENAIAADLEFKGKAIDLRRDIDTIGRDLAGRPLVACHPYLLDWDHITIGSAHGMPPRGGPTLSAAQTGRSATSLGW